MEHYGNLQTLDHLPETGDDLVDDKQIRAFLPAPDIVEHRSPFSDTSRDIWDAVQVEQWRFIRPLGRGGFGQVHLEEKIFERFPQSQGSRPQLRAVKIIPERNGGLRTMHHLPEILGMAKFSKLGASFIQLFAWFQIDSEICIAMEWAPYGDLEDCVLKPLPEVEVQEVVRQISLAVVIMHERRFLHRDLKPKNVFVFRKQPESPEWRVKLGDFGVSKRVRDAANTSWHTSIEADCSAPEVLGLLGGDYTEESSYASPVDMWSLGYLAHWLLTKRYPISKFALPQYCRQMDPIPLSELANKSVSNQAVDFVKNLLHLTPATRMTAQEAYRHPWLALPDRRSMPSLERLNISYPLQQTRRSTSATSNGVLGHYGASQSAESQGSGTSNWTNQTLGHRPLYAPSGDYRDFSQEAAPFLTDSDQPMNDDEIDYDAIEAEIVALEAEEALREEEYMKKKAAEQEANRKREEKEAAAYEANMKELERRAEEEEIRREEERKSRQASGSADDNKRLFAELKSGNHDKTGDFGGVDSEATDSATTPPKHDPENPNAEREGNARTEMPLQEPDHVESKTLKRFLEFAAAEKQKALERKPTQDRTVKLSDLQRFSKTFKLKTPPPTDLIGILTKDPAKQEAIIDSYRRQSQEGAELLQRPKWLQHSETAQSESAKHLSESKGGSQQKSVESHPKPSWAKVVASGVPVQEPAKKTSTDTRLSKNQKRRQKKRGANV